jgi:hypothetical protein
MPQQYNEITDASEVIKALRNKQVLKTTADMQELLNLLDGISQDTDEDSRAAKRWAIANKCREIEQDVQNL